MRKTLHSISLPAISALTLALSACNGGSNGASAPGLPQTFTPIGASLARLEHRRTSSKIQHIVIIVQENRSFNNLLYGFPGATTQSYGYDTNGNKINLVQIPL